jgi:hypothetical protein
MKGPRAGTPRLPVDSDAGAGLIGTIGGLTVFLMLLTFAVQMLFNLYATSAVTAVAHDAAAMAASGEIDRTDPDAVADAIRDAETHARGLLGDYGERSRFAWDLSDDRVRLTITASHPRIAMAAVSGVFGLNEVERSVEVRIEAPR